MPGARVVQMAPGAVAGRELQPEECLIVGDTPKDVEAAHAVGAPSLAVASHKYGMDELRAADPTHLIEALTEDVPLSG